MQHVPFAPRAHQSRALGWSQPIENNSLQLIVSLGHRQQKKTTWWNLFVPLFTQNKKVLAYGYILSNVLRIALALYRLISLVAWKYSLYIDIRWHIYRYFMWHVISIDMGGGWQLFFVVIFTQWIDHITASPPVYQFLDGNLAMIHGSFPCIISSNWVPAFPSTRNVIAVVLRVY